MNKRHYEHTLPNIRGSLSNTYGESKNRAGNNEKEVERIKNVKHETGQLEY